ncbi:hypothetical protein Tco_0484725 [Tanacetum coccineum]
MLQIFSQRHLMLADETVYKEWEDRMERAATTASSLDAEQDSGSGPRCQDTILGGVDAQNRFETTSKQSNDPLLLRFYTLRSGEDSMKLLELMELCTKLSDLVRIYQKSQENSQKRASTDTRTEECTKAGSKAKKSQNLSQTVKGKSNSGQPKSTTK